MERSWTKGTGRISIEASLCPHPPRRTAETCKSVSSCLAPRHNSLLEPDVGCPTREHGVPIESSARQTPWEDLSRFTRAPAADESNFANLERTRLKDSKAEIRLFGSYDDDRPFAVSDLPDCLPTSGGLILVLRTLGSVLLWKNDEHLRWRESTRGGFCRDRDLGPLGMPGHWADIVWRWSAQYSRHVNGHAVHFHPI